MAKRMLGGAQLKRVGRPNLTAPAMPDRMADLSRAANGQAGTSTQNPGFESYQRGSSFAVTINRDSADITSVLPVPLFGTDYINSKYNLFTGGKGVTVDTITYGTDGSVIITYSSGGNEDIVTITANTEEYSAILSKLQGSRLTYQSMQITIDDTADILQFSQQFSFLTQNMFGGKKENVITPNDYLSAYQQQDNTRVLQVSGEFGSDIVLGVPIIASALNYTVTFYGCEVYSIGTT